MNRRSLKIKFFSLILALMSILLLAACSHSNSTTPDNTNNFPVIVFSDIHFDPFYDRSLFWSLVNADSSQWACIFSGSSVTSPSAWGSDTNYPLLVLALSSIKQNLGASPLIIYTGDLLGHHFPDTFFSLYGSDDVAAMQTFADKTVSFVMDQVRASVGNIPVMFAIGNADSYVGVIPEKSFLSNTAELFYTKFLNGIVDHQTFLDTFTSGGYYSAEPLGTNLKVIGLDTVIFSTEENSAEVDAEFAWFDVQLADAQANGQRVWLLMHIPPGANLDATAGLVDSSGHITSAVMMWVADYQSRFLGILSNYPGIISLTLAAHTHMYEYRIMSSDNVLEITPGISPIFGNNPAFKVYSFTYDTFKPIDYSSLNYDLATMPEQFNNYYTFSAAYSMQGLLNDSLVQLLPSLATNNAQQAIYRGYYFSGHNYSVPIANLNVPITDTNWPVYWCGIWQMEKTGFINCVNSY